MLVQFDEFRTEVATLTHGLALVSVAGELDLYTSETVREALEVTSSDAETVVLDLSAVEFVDSTALGMLVGESKRLRDRGGRLALVFDDERTKRVFEVTGLDRVIRRYPSLADALSELLPKVREAAAVDS